MKVASLIGYGALGQQFYANLKDLNYLKFNYFDDNLFDLKHDFAKQFSLFKDDEYKNTDFYIALGYKNLKLKREILNELILMQRSIPNYIHYTSFINQTAWIGHSVFIYPKCNIDMNVSIDVGTIVNNSVVISHDAIIGSCCYISPGSIICGNVTIGDGTFIGAGTVISNGVKIGENVKIGLGSVITHNIPNNVSVIGNPMRILNSSLNL
jgi:sugar O-acyltransferase (sialic acid O-acetyltransferase NeuD family)